MTVKLDSTPSLLLSPSTPSESASTNPTFLIDNCGRATEVSGGGPTMKGQMMLVAGDGDDGGDGWQPRGRSLD